MLKTHINRFFLFISLITFYSSSLSAQVVYVPINDNIYKYLDRMNIKGIIQLDSEVKPFSRVYIAEKLVEIEKINLVKESKLTGIDQELLSFYKAEYGGEIEYRLKEVKGEINSNQSVSQMTFFASDKYNRKRLFGYDDTLFSFKLSPIAAYNIFKNGSRSGYKRSGGVRLYITVSDWFGGSVDMRDNGEFGDDIDRKKNFTAQRGADFISAPNGIEFSDVRAQINFSWDWGAISLRKDYSEWGNGYFGNVILSDKTPSYPNVYFEIKPINWFRFYYQFGWLHSGVIDSARTIRVNNDDDFFVSHRRFVKKYFVINMMTFSPWDIFDFSIGNAAIYAGDIRPEMFIPFNFYKYMDRDTGKKSLEDSNGMFFFDMVLRFPESFKFYTSLFVDVTSIRALLNGASHETWIGYTFGGKKVDFLIDNLDLNIEYTRVTPWAYEHRYESLTNYKHIGYVLGHWIGQNADQLKLQFNYQPIRGFRTELYAEIVRKGGFSDIKYAYDSVVEPFLYSPVRKDFYIGLDLSYEIFHELFIEGSYRYSEISDEDKNRTEAFMLDEQNFFSVGFRYGTL